MGGGASVCPRKCALKELVEPIIPREVVVALFHPKCTMLIELFGLCSLKALLIVQRHLRARLVAWRPPRAL